MTHTIDIGLTFTLKRGKRTPQDRTVVDILKTYNHKDELVRTRYVTEHKLLGQVITDSDVVRTTILRSIL